MNEDMMEIMKEEHVIFVFIDAANLWQAQKAKGKFFDYKKLMDFLKSKFKGDRLVAFYYTAYPIDGTRDYNLDGKHKFFTFLNKGLGMQVRKKALKQITVISETGAIIEEKGNMDVELTIDALHNILKYDTAILFTGDSDFLALVTYLRRGGKKIFIFSSKNNISQELRTGGNGYFDVLEVQEDIWGKELRYRSSVKSKKQPSARRVAQGCDSLPVHK